jgi:hypothetical protein
VLLNSQDIGRSIQNNSLSTEWGELVVLGLPLEKISTSLAAVLFRIDGESGSLSGFDIC